MITPWNEKNLKRVLVDMHIPDWNSEFMSRFFPEKMAELMKLSGTDVAQISGSSCLGLCFWPTKVGYPARPSAVTPTQRPTFFTFRTPSFRRAGRPDYNRT